MNFFINIIKGILIGSGAILPGISSGVMCIVFGVYEKFLDSLIHFFKAPIKNTIFFLPYIIGGIIGICFVGKLLLYLLNSHYVPTCFSFIGLILGGIPNIIKQFNKQIPNKLIHWVCLILTFIFSIYLIALEQKYSEEISSNKISQIYLCICGFFMSAGIVIPGVSSTVILMIMGVYDIYLNSISNINLEILFPLGLGILIGGILFLKIINILFKYFRSYTYYSIIGFSLGSIFVFFPRNKHKFRRSYLNNIIYNMLYNKLIIR